MRALSLGFVLVALGLGACGNPIQEIDMAVDCRDLCNRYRDCFDASYDTAACQDRCHQMVDRDPNAANECDACLDARACVETFGCASECQGLIP